MVENYLAPEVINVKSLEKLIEGFYPEHEYRKTQWFRYTTERIPIKLEKNPRYIQDEIERKCKPDRRLINHFEKEIVQTKTSYVVGNPIIINSYNEDEKIDRFIETFNIRINSEDLFHEVTNICSASGCCGVLLYKDRDANPKAIQLKPYEYKVKYEMNEPQFAFRWFFKNEEEYFEYFTDDMIYYFTKDENDNWFEYREPVLHGFGYIPIVEVKNNDERHSDYHSVTGLIDAYNRLISDFSNEVETFRLAYMILINMSATNEDLQALRETGAISVDKDGDVKFLEKKIDSNAIETMRKILERNISRFSGHVVFSDNDFTGNLTRIAVTYKIRPLEIKSLVYELKMKTFLREFYKVFASYKANKVKFDYTDLVFTFTRNIPINLQEEVDVFVKLKGELSEKTRLSMLSFVDNPQDEKELLEEEEKKKKESEKPLNKEEFNDEL